jgi:hypothetical protein
LLYADETILWRFALPRAGWWRTANRSRLTTGSLSRTQSKEHETRKRQPWQQHRSWSRVRAGVLLSVVGAVQYGTHKVFWKVVPHFATSECRQFIHQLMHTFGKYPEAPPVVMAVDRSGIHRAMALQTTLAHSQGRFRFYLLPARVVLRLWTSHRACVDTSGEERF